MDEKLSSGRVFEISNERQITGRRKIRVILHEIFTDHNQWQKNGISWDESYTSQNITSVANMSICAEFLDEERSLPYGHGLTEVRDNKPYMEGATVVGHCENAYIADIETKAGKKRALVAEGFLDEIRYPKFVAWLTERMKSGEVKGSVEIVGRAENDNRIIYDGGWKEKGRIPQLYDYSGYAILGIKPADDTAIVVELNNKSEKNKEDEIMDEKLMSQFVDLVKNSVTQTVVELNNKNEQYESKISELNSQLQEKDNQIAELNAQLKEAGEMTNEKDQMLQSQTAELNNLKGSYQALQKEKRIAELNSALAAFSAEEQAIAQKEIDAFKADPASVELNSITGKICVELVRRSREVHTHEQNNALPDIFGGMNDSEQDTVNIFGE